MLVSLPSAVRTRLPSVLGVSFRGLKTRPAANMVDAGWLDMTNQQMFDSLQALKDHNPMVKEFLTPDVYAKLKDAKTPLGCTLGHCIVSGVKEPTSSIGFLAADPDSYKTFDALTDPIIKRYHKVSGDIKHPPTNFGDLNNLPFGDLGDAIVSTRVRVGRSLDGYAMVTMISKAARLEMEEKIKKCLESMTGDHKGTYYHLLGMKEDVKQKLIEDHFLFSDAGDKYNLAAGVYRDWPAGRGIFHNDNKTFLVWNNEEDHLRIISMQKGGNLAEVYKRLVQGIQMLEKATPYAHSDKLGWLTCCPTNLGTALRASVHAKVPKLSANKAEFEAICDKYNIQARGIYGEHTESVGGVYDLSNKRRLGISELDAVTEMANGVKAILKRESEFQKAVMELPMPQDDLVKKLQGYKDQKWSKEEPNATKNLVKKYMTPEMYAKLKDKKTKLGGNIGHVILAGTICPNSSIGMLVPDPDAYEVFAPFCDLVIKDYHKLPMDKPIAHPDCDFGDVSNLPFGDLDPSGNKIVSTRVRVGRTVEGYAMVTQITKAARLEMEEKISGCLKSMTGQHKGTYYKLAEMDDKTKTQLVMDHFMFNDREDPYLEAGGAYRDWPAGRGIYHNDDKTFLIWNNEEDHLRIISMQKGGNLAEVYKRLVEGIKMLEKAVPYAHSKKLGYLTSCPTNLGTAMRASVHVKIPKLAAKLGKEGLEEFCDKFKLQPRGIHGENSESEGGVYDVSNKVRLGITEFDAVKLMAEGVMKLIQEEDKL